MMIKNTMISGGGLTSNWLGFILVGDTNRFAISPDGLTWEVRTTPWTDNSGYWISSICQGSDGSLLLGLNTGTPTMYATSSAAGALYRSVDSGNSWTLVDTVTYGVVPKFVHDAFFAREFGSSTHASSHLFAVRRSADGTTWTQVDDGNDIVSLVHWIDYGAGAFVTADGGQNNQMNNPPRWSSDGITWQDALSGGFPYGSYSCAHSVAYASGYFSTWMMRSNDGSYTGQHRSSDGMNWSSANGTIRNVAGAGDYLYGARSDASAYSTDGLATQTSLGLPLEYPNAAYFDGHYVLIDCSVATSTPDTNIYHSTDGTSFTGYSPPAALGGLVSVQAAVLPS